MTSNTSTCWRQGMQLCLVCGSVRSCVSWTGAGSIADINEMEATSGDGRTHRR